MFDFGSCPALTYLPGRVGGAWTIGPTRMPVWILFANIGNMTVEEFCDMWPTATPERVRCVLACLKTYLEDNRPGGAA